MYVLCFDGLFKHFSKASAKTARGGVMGYGWYITRDEVVIAKGRGVFAHGEQATSGIAEYLALLEGLDALRDLCARDEPVEVRGDAKFIIDQMTGASLVTSESIKPLHRQARRLAKRFRQVTWTWTARRYNRRADALSREALCEAYLDCEYYQWVASHPLSDPQEKGPTHKFLSLADLRVYQPSGVSL